MANLNDSKLQSGKQAAADQVDQAAQFKAEELAFKVKEKPSIEKFDRIKSVWDEAGTKDFLHLVTDDQPYNGFDMSVKGQALKNFGSCGYLGLEQDPRLKNAAKQAIDQYGTQFSLSPVYLSVNIYEQLKDLYSQLFESNVLLASTTTLGHLATIPIVVDERDLILLDQQVHNSVQMAVQSVMYKGATTKTIPHSNVDYLRRIIQSNKDKHRKIWYFCDGVYSMHGDLAPIKELQKLQEEFEQLWLYIDDAHGMSWTGKNGSGFAFSELSHRRNCIVLTSNNKCFGCAGGSIIIDDDDLAEKVRLFGPTNIFSGPIQPAMMGAAVASAGIHLSSEIYELQDKLKAKIALRNKTFEDYNIDVYHSTTPILFVKVGSPEQTGKLVSQLKRDGYYVNAALYPAVHKRHNGLRITTTNLQPDEAIKDLAALVHSYLDKEKASN